MMEIEVKESTMVKPMIGKPSTTLMLSNLDLTAPYIHVPGLLFYRSTGAPDFFDSATVKAALSRVLVEFYPMAGRLQKNSSGRLEINCNGEGASFVEAECQGILRDDFGDFVPKPEMRVLTPPVDYSLGISSYPILLVQVTRFKCGGVCLGTAIHHLVADGSAGLHFMKTWCTMSRGLDATVVPVIDRSILAARDPPQPQFSHVEYQPPPIMKSNTLFVSLETDVAVVKVTLDQIFGLKAKCQQLDPHMTCTTYEVLAGHVWQCVTKARALPKDQETRLYVPVDGRSRMKKLLPPNYFGNAIFKATCIATCGELESNPLNFVVQRVHEAIARMDEDYLRSAIDSLELQGGDFMRGVPLDYKCPNLAINSLVRFNFNDVDFGWGKPDYMRSSDSLIREGLIVVLPYPANDGSLLFAITLPKEQMQVFKDLLYAI